MDATRKFLFIFYFSLNIGGPIGVKPHQRAVTEKVTRQETE